MTWRPGGNGGNILVLNTKFWSRAASPGHLANKQTVMKNKNIWGFWDDLHICPAFVICHVFPFLIIIFRHIPHISLSAWNIHPLMSNLHSSDREFIVLIFLGGLGNIHFSLLSEQQPEPCSRKSHSWIIILVPAIMQILKMLMKGKQPWETEWRDSIIRKRGVNISIQNWACFPCFFWHNKM